MRLLPCPKEEWLLQYVSIRKDVPVVRRLRIAAHLRSCKHCATKRTLIGEKLEAYFSPPDITSSLLRVYSRLQQDETLILKGWKLGEIAPSQRKQRSMLANGWAFRGAVVAGLGALAVIFVMADRQGLQESQAQRLAQEDSRNVPFAQIRFEDKNRVQVHYIKPELVRSVEFETTGMR
ncbi:MAG: hypothetical protein KDD39_11575 [Bdellovibrionales bacterium]|nr:hypothetical protein [Bdellovibrionales bacterium]